MATTRRTVLGALLAVGLAAGAQAQEATGQNGATVRKWAEGLAGPQGLVRGPDGGLLIVEHDAGRVRRFAPDGKPGDVFAEGLLSPAWALWHQGALFVSERKGNSVARATGAGSPTRLPGTVPDPLGLALDPKRPGVLLVLSHRESVVRAFRLTPDSGALLEQPFVSPAAGAKYGWRDVAVRPDGTTYVTDEVSHAILRRTPGGALTEWVKGLKSPSGLGFGPRGDLYFTEEGGRLSRVDAAGKVTILAEGLGAARALLFLDPRTVLVTDRKGGNVWEVRLP
jgi:virginiamycin B lyase